MERIIPTIQRKLVTWRHPQQALLEFLSVHVHTHVYIIYFETANIYRLAWMDFGPFEDRHAEYFIWREKWWTGSHGILKINSLKKKMNNILFLLLKIEQTKKKKKKPFQNPTKHKQRLFSCLLVCMESWHSPHLGHRNLSEGLIIKKTCN